MEESKFYIYKITNLINNKVYIGKTVNPKKRWNDHIRVSKQPKNPKFFIIHRAIAKYGVDNFSFEVICEHESEEECFSAEIKFISLFNSIKFGYNIALGGRGGLAGLPHSLEHRQKISKSLKGKTKGKTVIATDEMRKKNGETYKRRHLISDDKKQEIINLYNTCKYTKEQLAEKLSIELRTVLYIVGKLAKRGIFTEEEKHLHRSEAHKGKRFSEEHKRKISEGNMGKVASVEARAKISASKIGDKNGMYNRPQSEESKQKMSQFQKQRARRPLSDEEKQNLRLKLTGRKNIPLSVELKENVLTDWNSKQYTKRQLAKKHNVLYNTVCGIIKRAK